MNPPSLLQKTDSYSAQQEVEGGGEEEGGGGGGEGGWVGGVSEL